MKCSVSVGSEVESCVLTVKGLYTESDDISAKKNKKLYMTPTQQWHFKSCTHHNSTITSILLLNLESTELQDCFEKKPERTGDQRDVKENINWWMTMQQVLKCGFRGGGYRIAQSRLCVVWYHPEERFARAFDPFLSVRFPFPSRLARGRGCRIRLSVAHVFSICTEHY